MSAIRRLLCAAVPLALAMGACGAGGVPAETVPLDSMGSDSDRISSMAQTMSAGEGLSQPRWKRFAAGEEAAEEEAEEAGVFPGGSVGAATPAMGEAVREMYGLNPYSAGWLTIPDTGINDVVMKNPRHLDNDFYLTHNFQNQPDENGMYCADFRSELYNSRAGLSRVTAIYGHSWDDDPDGTLFSQLKRYRDPEFARSHPYIYFSNACDDMAFEVFAVFDTTIHLPYIRPETGDDTFRSMIAMAGELSLYRYDAAVGADDKVMALSTCTYSVAGHPSLPAPNDYRFVVMAKLVEPEEAHKAEAALTLNESPLPPDATLAFKTP